MKTFFRKALVALTVLLTFATIAGAQAVPGQPVVFPNFNVNPNFMPTATNTTSRVYNIPGMGSGLIESGSLLRSGNPIVNPTPVASTTGAGSTATFVVPTANDYITGTLVIQVGTGPAVGSVTTIVLPKCSTNPTPASLTPQCFTLTMLIGYLNNNTQFATSDKLVATVSSNSLVITGPQDSTVNGTNTLIVSSSSLTYSTQAVSYTYAAPASVASGTSTYSTLTYTFNNSADTLAGTVTLFVGPTGTPFSITIPQGTTLTQAVTLLNANTTFHTTYSITASTSTNTLVFTGGVYGTGGTQTINVSNYASLIDNTVTIAVTWAIQGSLDYGVTWFTIPFATYPTTTVPITTTVQSASPTAPTPVLYTVNLNGLTNIRFVTSSTFTAGMTLNLDATFSATKGYL